MPSIAWLFRPRPRWKKSMPRKRWIKAAMEDENAFRLRRLLGYLEDDPENFSLLSDAGDLCLRIGNRAVARPLLERALKLQPKDPANLFRMSTLMFAEHAYQDCLGLTFQLLDLGQAHMAIRRQHALCLVNLSRFAEAAPILRTLVEGDAPYPDLPHTLLRTLHHIGCFKEAAAFAESHLERNPGDATARGMQSLLFLDQERYVEAERIANEVLRVQPRNLDALLAAGSSAIALEREGRALELFGRAIETGPRNGRAWLGLGLGHMLSGELSEAAEEMKRALQYMPEHLGSWNALAWVMILQRDLDGASATLRRSLRVNRNFGETHGGLAVVAAMRDDWGLTRVRTEMALRLQPGCFAGRFAQSLLVAQEGTPDKAVAMLNELLDQAHAPAGGNLSGMIRRFAARSHTAWTGIHGRPFDTADVVGA
jgi:tetratricopeptide (TPR) repeat protein